MFAVLMVPWLIVVHEIIVLCGILNHLPLQQLYVNHDTIATICHLTAHLLRITFNNTLVCEAAIGANYFPSLRLNPITSCKSDALLRVTTRLVK